MVMVEEALRSRVPVIEIRTQAEQRSAPPSGWWCACWARIRTPALSREHVLLSVLAERRMLAGQSAELDSLLDEVLTPKAGRTPAIIVSVPTWMMRSARSCWALADGRFCR